MVRHLADYEKKTEVLIHTNNYAKLLNIYFDLTAYESVERHTEYCCTCGRLFLEGP